MLSQRSNGFSGDVCPRCRSIHDKTERLLRVVVYL